MSERAIQEREIKRHWAEPGSRHDRVVRGIKIGLPVVIGGLLAILAVAPFGKSGDVSFILDKNKVEEAPERMRVESARYAGEDNKGRPFTIVADRAVQPTSEVPVVNIRGMRAQLNMEKGPLTIAAPLGRYDLDRKLVDIIGPVNLAGPDGYRLSTSNVRIDLDQRQMKSTGEVTGSMRLGDFQAGSLSAQLDDRIVRLDGKVRLKIVQGAVR